MFEFVETMKAILHCLIDVTIEHLSINILACFIIN